MKNPVIAPLTVSLLAVLITGCGENDDSVDGSGNSNQIILSNFDSSYDNQVNDLAIARIDTLYETGKREISIRNIVNNYTNQNLNNLDKTVLADKFEGRLENKNIEVKDRTVKRPVYQQNSNQKINYVTTYNTLDLSGLKANSYVTGTTVSNSRGIITALNNFSKISVNATFPSGSVCYIPVTTSDRAFLAFNDKNKTGYTSLDRWVKAAEERFSDNRGFSTIRFKVGTGNSLNAAQVNFFEFKTQPVYHYTGVEFKQDIYEADYVANGSNDPNTDSRRGVVDCTLVNDVAADFLEREIVKYY